MGAAQWTSEGCSFGLGELESQKWLVDVGVGVGGI